MTGPLADPTLTALILWFLLPAALLVGIACFAMWRSRRDWVVVEAVIRAVPAPDDAAGLTEIAWRDDAGDVQVSRIRLPPAKRPARPGALLSLSHPPGEPDSLQTGTPGPLLAGAIGSALVAALCASILLGV
ncbi:hypothetical protein GWK16_11470 [Roseomonas sp. JC162]|uniref:Uncharacterized protein n=1 Tax=Neoroseomonas marina TaxID=1232220 RepID=A0A848EEI3_9PROT|nr:hypothetical protein [Neoroseomonas marina]NMJ41863.1 hypothetical protein [Neoroseomonas marina]